MLKRWWKSVNWPSASTPFSLLDPSTPIVSWVALSVGAIFPVPYCCWNRLLLLLQMSFNRLMQLQRIHDWNTLFLCLPLLAPEDSCSAYPFGPACHEMYKVALQRASNQEMCSLWWSCTRDSSIPMHDWKNSMNGRIALRISALWRPRSTLDLHLCLTMQVQLVKAPELEMPLVLTVNSSVLSKNVTHVITLQWGIQKLSRL